ncbi:hypothetical protein ACQKH5_07185 [Hyphomonas sp. NPDC076900]|uniref:hypothetical protein n=1 Tax=Hyphomonas sp. NPDC076900 TaxID=3390570 RepID=UPI003D03076C
MIEAIRRVVLALVMLCIGSLIATLCWDLGGLTATPELVIPGYIMGALVVLFTAIRTGNMLYTGRYFGIQL